MILRSLPAILYSSQFTALSLKRFTLRQGPQHMPKGPKVKNCLSYTNEELYKVHCQETIFEL